MRNVDTLSDYIVLPEVKPKHTRQKETERKIEMNIGVERTWREKLLIKELQELKLEYTDLSERFKAQAWEISSLTIENTKLKEDLGE